MTRREPTIRTKMTAAELRRHHERHQQAQADAPRGGSRRDGPLLEGPSPDTQDAQALIGRMLRDGMVTRHADGTIHLRSYGRDALTALRLIADHDQQAGD